jgi:lipoyl(octanoyl) transferase
MAGFDIGKAMKPRSSLISPVTNPVASASAVEWHLLSGLSDYAETLRRMEETAAHIANGKAPEQVWLLEHPPLYTAGTSAKPADLIDPTRFPVFEVGRGGQYTYHGPGQRIAYVMLNLKARGGDVRAFVAALESWIIRTLSEFGIEGERREDRVGVWVKSGDSEAKIAALGIRVRRGVTFHGISINLDPDLSHFDGIVPCGVSEHGVTSITAIKPKTTMQDLDRALRGEFNKLFAA